MNNRRRGRILLICLLCSVMISAGKYWSLPYTGNIEDQLELFSPKKGKSTGQAVLVLPGGGYRNLSYNEKELTARWLQSQGVMAIALSYRLPHGESMLPISDAWAAMRYIRAHADEWGIDPHQVGVAGFSAGGHLAATLSVHNDEDTRPDFSLLFYPVITFHEPRGTRTQLCGENITPEQEAYFSTEDHVNALTSPTFFVMTSTDATVPAYHSVSYVQRLMQHRAYCDAHFYPEGKHGFCFKTTFPYYAEMTAALSRFLKAQQQHVSDRYTHRIGTYNVRVATKKDTGEISWDARKQYVAQLIRDEKMEIVGLQEIKTPQQLRDLKTLLPEYAFVSWGRESAENDTTGEQVAIAYLKDQFTLDNSDHFFLTPDPKVPGVAWDAQCARVAVYVKLLCLKTNQLLHVCCTHLDHKGSEARKGGLQLICNRLKNESKYYPLIILGDMNTKTDQDEQDLLHIVSPYFQDARAISVTAPKGCDGTWAGWKKDCGSRRLDYMYVHNIEVLSYETIQRDYDRGVTPSDHFPVVITIRY